MPERPDDPSDRPDLSEEDDARIRSLLADAADPEPLPDDVAARLDDRLALLVAERSRATSAPAVRRAGRARLLLVAAAAVAVVGAGVPIVRSFEGGVSADSGAAGSATSAQEDSTDSSGGGTFDGLKAPAPENSANGGDRALPGLSTTSFRRDVRRLLADGRARSTEPLATTSAAGCARLSARPAGVRKVFPVAVDGTQALLELYTPAGGVRRVVAVTCDGTVLASTTVPAR